MSENSKNMSHNNLPKPQVDYRQYFSRKYNHRVRWMNFWHQIDEICGLEPQEVLEVGKGNGLVSDHLKKMGYPVKTLDIDPEVCPDVVGSIHKLPFVDNEFDLILAAEVLEHLPFENVPQAVSELKRVSRRFVIITLPYAGSRFLFRLKIPKIPELIVFLPIPYFWKKHKKTSEHFWEMGKRGFSRGKIRRLFAKCGFKVLKEKIFHDDFNHIFFVLENVN